MLPTFRFDMKTLRRLVKARLSYRSIMRESRLLLIVAAGLAGALGGVVSSLMSTLAQYCHELFFGIAHNTRLSSIPSLDPKRVLIVLLVGGLAVGLSTWLWRWWRKTGDIIDPIEANALHGGRMSLRDSFFVMAQSILSDGVGASVGLEGGYTQGGGAVGSKIGMFIGRRRNDVRMLVGAGAAGAIAGAFDSAFAGAAYSFELIIGSYTVATLAPIATAGICGFFAARALATHVYRIPLEAISENWSSNLPALIVLAVIAALLGVVLMRGVTQTETFFRSSRMPVWIRPMIGGAVVALLALGSPHVLGSGHGGMETIMKAPPSFLFLLALLFLKIVACAISIGSGFRGGLFSASLFLGALTGAAFAKMGETLGILAIDDFSLFMMVGMASFAAAVVGAPLTMVALAATITFQLQAVVPAMVGVVAAMLTVRRIFGYSFATWRFHLRGEAILGGHDIGWVYETTARQLMRRDPPVTRGDVSVAQFAEHFPLAGARYVVGLDQEQNYAGLVDVALAHFHVREEGGDQTPISTLFAHPDAYVTASASVNEVLPEFERLKTEIMVVVDNEERRNVLGVISEEYALRMYQQQLEDRQKEIFAG